MTGLPSPLDRLRLPILVAPMFLTSTPDLVVSACENGLMGALPALNARTTQGLDDWLCEIERRLAQSPQAAPYAVNLIVHASNHRLEADLEVVVRHRVPVVITGFGADPRVVEAVHGYGGLVFHDVASRRHAEKVAQSGVDGVIVLGAGAGGHTGHLSPFALVAEVRQVFDGLILLAGAISTGSDVAVARAMGADLVVMGTRFIATQEAAVSPAQKAMMVEAGSSDVVITPALTGNPATFLKPSLRAVGLNPDDLLPHGTPGALGQHKPWRDLWSAGHGVGAITDVPDMTTLVGELARDYRATIHRLAADPFAARGDIKIGDKTQ